MEGKLYKINNIYTLMVNDKMIASNDEDFQIDYEIKKLSLKNCQAIENGYDLDELVKNMGEEFYVFGNYDFENGVKKGFLKALEIIGDKKFSEDDVISMIKKSREKTPYNFDGKSTEYKFSEDELIQSLQQTEWDVEIEMNIIPELLKGSYPEEKLDDNDCLILKRK